MATYYWPAGNFLPTGCTRWVRWLLKRVDAGLRDLGVNSSVRAATDANCTNDLTANYDGDAAGRGNDVIERENGDTDAAGRRYIADAVALSIATPMAAYWLPSIFWK
jgi:hypothetical protein